MEGTIHKIAFGVPSADTGQYLREAGAAAAFYAALLGMRVYWRDGDDPRVEPDGQPGPGIAFENEPAGYLPPRWPDPDRPQQMHLDILVSDLDVADELVRKIGATPLREEGGDYRVYADPVGHPFCLYEDRASTGKGFFPGGIGRVVIDCFSPRTLAAFYAELLDMPRRVLDSPERVVIAKVDGGLPMLAFQHSLSPAPRWPDPAYSQQAHLDLYFDDAPAAQTMAEQLGAVRLPAMGGGSPVFADPAAHPFCICARQW